VRRLWDRIPPLARGLAIVALIAAVVVALSLEPVVATVGGLVWIAFYLAVAFFLFLVWRERLRSDIESWPRRAQLAFYGGAALIALALGVLFWTGFDVRGFEAVALLVAIALAAFSMWRVWRDEHTYSV
jgi:hypothetical protein